MFFTILQLDVRSILTHLPWLHWGVMSLLAIALIITLRIHYKYSVYSAVVMGLMVFVVLFLLDITVYLRYIGVIPHDSSRVIKMSVEPFSQVDVFRRVELLGNFVVFIPFGFLLTESLTSMRRIVTWRRLWFIALVGFGLSLLIESLQLVLHIGFFEVSDLVMNTMGMVVGALISKTGRKVFKR